MNFPRSRLAVLIVTLAALTVAAPARAGFSITLDSTSPSGANTIYNSSPSIASDDQIVTGDFFRIYDFAGLVAGSIVTPANWTASTALSDPTPPPNVPLSHGDDPTITNITFTYTGAAAIAGPVDIPGFSATSTLVTTIVKDFVGRDTLAVGANASSGGSAI